MLHAMDQLPSSLWAAVAGFAVLSSLYSLVVGGLLLTGRRVPPVLAVAPTGVALLVACGVAFWSAGNLPWDTSTVGAVRRIELATPDFLMRTALFPAIYPGLALLVATSAIAAPLRGPRTTWPAGVGLLLALLGFFALTAGAMLDLAATETGVLLLLVGPLALVALIALIRGDEEGAGPEASVIGAVAFGHAVAAGVTAVLAVSRYDQLLTHVYAGDPAAWRAPAAAIAVLATVGMSAAATTGVTATRPRTYAGVGALATLGLWVPLAMVGALTQLV
ncbi:MAG: hypothetical protein H6737_26550 [Alphaproteobacteria bacterium]|nr:hypothetical protein [Alphaproteobacteria bacterium]